LVSDGIKLVSQCPEVVHRIELKLLKLRLKFSSCLKGSQRKGGRGLLASVGRFRLLSRYGICVSL